VTKTVIESARFVSTADGYDSWRASPRGGSSGGGRCKAATGRAGIWPSDWLPTAGRCPNVPAKLAARAKVYSRGYGSRTTRTTRPRSAADGDNWLAANLPTIFNSPEYQDGSTAVFLTWDEGEGGTAINCATNTADVGCHVAAIAISPSTVPGTTSSTLFNHYSLLGTAEQLLGLPRLSLASSYPTLTSAFHL